LRLWFQFPETERHTHICIYIYLATNLSIYIEDLNIRDKNHKILGKYRVNFYGFEIGKGFIVIVPKAQAAKEKKNKLSWS
jgi:hypothetical protein